MGGLVLRLEQVVDFTVAIRRAHLALLLAHLIADAFLGGNDLQVFLVILGADGGRSLEHHVLEEVSDAGDAQAFIRAAGMRHPPARDGRLVVPLDQQQPHAVGQGFLDHRHLLGRQRQRPVQE